MFHGLLLLLVRKDILKKIDHSVNCIYEMFSFKNNFRKHFMLFLSF